MALHEFPVPDTHEVHMFEWKVQRNSGVLRTLGAASCIALSVYDPSSLHTFLGHIPTRTASSEALLNAMLQAVRTTVENTSDLRIWAGGAFTGRAPIDRGLDEMAIHDREFVLSTVGSRLELPTDTIRTSWLSRPSFLDYMIDTHTGFDMIEVTPIAD